MLARRALPAPASRCSPPPPVPGRYRGVARPRVRTAAFEPPGGMDPVSAGVDVSSDAYGIKGLPNALTSTVLASWYNKTVGGPHVLMNLVGEQTGDLSLGPLSIKYAVETDSQHVRLVAKLGSQSIVTSGERGSFKLADGDSSECAGSRQGAWLHALALAHVQPYPPSHACPHDMHAQPRPPRPRPRPSIQAWTPPSR